MDVIFIFLNILICGYMMITPIIKNRLQMQFYVGLVTLLLFVFPAIVVELINYYSIKITSENHAAAVSQLQYVPVNAFCFLGLLAILIGLRLPLPINIKINYRNTSSFVLQPKFMIFVLAMVGIISSYIFATGFGSTTDAIFYSNLVRSGVFIESWGGSTDFLFYKRFIFLLLLVLILSPLYFKKNFSNNFIYLFIFFVFFLFLLYLNKGRQAVIDLFLIYLFSLLIIRKIGFISLFIFGSTSIFALVFLDSFFDASFGGDINLSLNVDFLNWYIIEFGNAYLSVGIAWYSNDNLLFFSDFFYSLFGNVLPTYSDWVTRETNYINSRNFGSLESSYPPGIFAFGFYNLSVFGIFLYSLLIGVFLNFLDKVGQSLVNLTPKANLLYAYLIVNSAVILRTGSPRFYFYDTVNLSLVIFLVIAFTFHLYSKQK